MRIIPNSIQYDIIFDLPATKYKGKVGSFYKFEMTMYDDGIPIFEPGLPEGMENYIIMKITQREGIIFPN